MKKNRKPVALLLSILLLAALLTGCGGAGAQNTTAAPAEEDVVYDLTGLSRDTVLFTVNGADVTAETYLFWLSQSISTMDQYATYLGGEGIDWEEEMSGLSMADYCKNDAMETCKLYTAVELEAEEKGCSFNEANEPDLQADLDAMIEQLGGQETYELWLLRAGLSEEGIRKLNEISYDYQNLQDTLFGSGGENAPTDESMDTYITENDLLSAKHILLLTVDTSSTDAETGGYAKLSDDVIAEKRQQAEDILAQLRESDDPVALFDTLMNEYSEDSGLSSEPDGYVFSAGEMVPGFETATRLLEYGEISDIVESDYGYHIILRQDPDTETLRSQWITDQMNTMLEDWVTNAVIVTTDAYDAIDPQDYYTRLLAHQEEVDVLIEAVDESAAPASTGE